jgi:hypothetical protein
MIRLATSLIATRSIAGRAEALLGERRSYLRKQIKRQNCRLIRRRRVVALFGRSSRAAIASAFAKISAGLIEGPTLRAAQALNGLD